VFDRNTMLKPLKDLIARKTNRYAFRGLHFRLNRSKLEHAMEKREDKLDRQFLGQDRVEGAGPWI
jgi:hypothetical protein